MTKGLFILTALVSLAGLSYQASAQTGAPEPHVNLQKGYARPAGGAPTSPLLLYHNGPVIHSSKTMAVFWGPGWANSTFAGDKITGMDLFFNGYNNSSLAKTVTEYSDNAGFITSTSTYLGHTMDASTAPQRSPKTSQIIAEACKIANNNPDPSALYALYSDTALTHVNYCGFHTWGTCSNGAPIQAAFIPSLDGINGCNPGDTASGHSEGLAAIANVTSHELSETITDPRGSAWFDAQGEENGDKCNFAFPPGTGLSTLSNGSMFKLQMEWSNAAYTNGTGLANLNGQKGCIY